MHPAPSWIFAKFPEGTRCLGICKVPTHDRLLDLRKVPGRHPLFRTLQRYPKPIAAGRLQIPGWSPLPWNLQRSRKTSAAGHVQSSRKAPDASPQQGCRGAHNPPEIAQTYKRKQAIRRPSAGVINGICTCVQPHHATHSTCNTTTRPNIQ